MVAVAMRTITAKLSNRAFSAAEAGAMLGLGAIEVSNLIPEIAPLGIANVGRGHRTIQFRGLFMMLVARELTYCQLKPEMRRETMQLVLNSTAKRVSVPGTNLQVLVEPYRKQANKGLRSLYEAEASVVSHNGIMQGEPCLRGTRVPVYVVSAIAAKHGIEEALATYPYLKKHQVEHAVMFANAHPRRGRPKKTAFPSGAKIVSKKTIVRKKPEAGA